MNLLDVHVTNLRVRVHQSRPPLSESATIHELINRQLRRSKHIKHTRCLPRKLNIVGAECLNAPETFKSYFILQLKQETDSEFRFSGPETSATDAAPTPLVLKKCKVTCKYGPNTGHRGFHLTTKY